MIRRSPYDVPCPYCQREAGFGCVSRGASSPAPHIDRWKAAGIPQPTDRQKELARLDLRRREARRREAAFAAQGLSKGRANGR